MRQGGGGRFRSSQILNPIPLPQAREAVSPSTTRPQQNRSKKQRQSPRALLSLTTCLSILPPSTLQASLKGLKKGPPSGALGVPFPSHENSSPSHLDAPGLLHETNSFFNRHQVREAILASLLSPSALIGRLPEPRANHAAGKR